MPWTDADYERMIAHLREERAKLGENQRPKKEPKAKKVAPELAGKSGLDILDILGMGKK